MKYIRLGLSDVLVSKLSLGTWEMGGDSVWSNESDAESLRILDEAAEHGVNFIDTAPLYGHGHSEELVARAIRGRRSRFVVATKCTLNWEGRGEFQFERDGADWRADFSREGLRRDLEGSLRRLGTDYVDLYYTHRAIPAERTQEALEAMLQFKKEGKIRAIGLSNMRQETFDLFAENGCLDAVQLKYSLLDPEYGDQFFAACEEKGIVYQAFSALARGILTGRLDATTVVENQAHKAFGWFEMERRADLLAMLEGWKQTLCEKYDCSLASLALAWTMARSPSLSVLFGVRRLANLRDTLHALDVTLEARDSAKMERDALALNKKYKHTEASLKLPPDTKRPKRA